VTGIVYICAAGHCGSTLLDLLIGSHSNAASLGEISHLPKNVALNTLCSCGERVRSCPVWGSVLDDLSARLGSDYWQLPYQLVLGYPNPTDIVDPEFHTDWYKVRRRLRLALRYLELTVQNRHLHSLVDRLDPTVRHSFALYRSVGSRLNVDWVVDSSKNYMKALALYREMPSKVRIILLTRDGRGVLHSMLKRGFNRRESIENWKRYYERSALLLERHIAAQHLLTIRYEDLTAATQEALGRVCAFLQIPHESGMRDFASHTHHITNGNNMRFTKDSTIRPDMEWKEKLAKIDISDFQDLAGGLNARLGYERSPA